MRVLLLTDPRMDAHQPPGHPERPARREAVAAGVRDAATAWGAPLDEPEVDEADREALLAVHSAHYLDALAAIETAGGGWLDAYAETFLGPGSLTAARLAAGAALAAGRAAVAGDATVAFAVGRPPGHHAARERAAGFCLLNSIAVAAAGLRREGVARVAILDWDVHHGDGTQAIFAADPSVLYASTHQWPYYPGTGTADERGTGAGVGTTHNAPLAAGSGDAELLAAWRERLLPAVEAFAPGALLISAGYDAHRADPLAALAVSGDGFGALGTAVGELAARLGLPGVALVLEGGYDLQALRESAAATVGGLLTGMGHARPRGPETPSEAS